VKAKSGKRGSRCFWEPVTDCDRFSPSTSVRSSRNRKSSGNRSAFRDGLVQGFGRDAVEHGELGIEDDALTTQQKDRAGARRGWARRASSAPSHYAISSRRFETRISMRSN
jgi:hypothetical protein